MWHVVVDDNDDDDDDEESSTNVDWDFIFFEKKIFEKNIVKFIIWMQVYAVLCIGAKCDSFLSNWIILTELVDEIIFLKMYIGKFLSWIYLFESYYS